MKYSAIALMNDTKNYALYVFTDLYFGHYLKMKFMGCLVRTCMCVSSACLDVP